MLVENARCECEREEEEGEDELVASGGKSVTAEQLKGLPLYLSCFPIPDGILCDN